MKKVIDTRTMSVTFTFDDELPNLVFRSDDASEANKDYAMLHGFGARIGDNAALSRKGPHGEVVTITEAMRRVAVQEMADFYSNTQNVEWNMKVSERKAPQNATILAIATKRGCTYAEAEAYVAEKMLAELAD